MWQVSIVSVKLVVQWKSGLVHWHFQELHNSNLCKQNINMNLLCYNGANCGPIHPQVTDVRCQIWTNPYCLLYWQYSSSILRIAHDTHRLEDQARNFDYNLVTLPATVDCLYIFQYLLALYYEPKGFVQWTTEQWQGCLAFNMQLTTDNRQLHPWKLYFCIWRALCTISAWPWVANIEVSGDGSPVAATT